jgi:hypothetical protein
MPAKLLAAHPAAAAAGSALEGNLRVVKDGWSFRQELRGLAGTEVRCQSRSRNIELQSTYTGSSSMVMILGIRD